MNWGNKKLSNIKDVSKTHKNTQEHIKNIGIKINQ